MNMACNWEEDCRIIHVDDGLSKVISLLGRRSLQERRQIREKYSTLYGEDLIEHLLQRSTTSNGNNSQVYKMLSLWMMEPSERDAVIASNAVKNVGHLEFMALTEIYACRKPNQLFLVKQTYQAKFKTSLDRDIVLNNSTTHPYSKILMAVSASQHSHEAEMTSSHIAKCDAKRLYEASRDRIDDSVVLEILSKRSILQFRLTLSTYTHIYGHKYSKSLKKVTRSTEFEESLRDAVRCIEDPPKYFSKMLYLSIKGKAGVEATSTSSTLVRVMVTRAEVDMAAIKEEFHQKYKMKLQDAIVEHCVPIGDNFRDFLVALADTPTLPKT